MEFNAHLSYLFSEFTIPEQVARARRGGFEFVESTWPGGEVDVLVAALQEAGLRLYLVNTDGGDLASTGGRGCLNDPARHDEAMAAINGSVALGASFIHVLVGRGSGIDTVAGVLREAVAEVGDATLLVEHLNPVDSPQYLLPTPADAIALVEAVGSDRLRLLYDAYHAAMVGEDPIRQISEVVSYLGHVHYAEAPGRVRGERFGEFVEAVAASGYQGRIGLEYYAHGEPVDYPQFNAAA